MTDRPNQQFPTSQESRERLPEDDPRNQDIPADERLPETDDEAGLERVESGDIEGGHGDRRENTEPVEGSHKLEEEDVER